MPLHELLDWHYGEDGAERLTRLLGDGAGRDGAEERRDVYVELTEMLLEAGSSLRYPDDRGGEAYYERLLDEASPGVVKTLAR
jgi:hypothetical protein